MSETNEQKLYRVHDKKDRYHQTYSPKLEGGKEWAVDCATIIKGKVYEVILNELGVAKSSKIIFSIENK